MKLGIGLPNTMAHELDRGLIVDWARPTRARRWVLAYAARGRRAA